MISIKFFATFREIIGKKELDVEYREGMTMGDLLQELCSKSESMEKACFENGKLRDYDELLINGHNIQFLNGLDTVLQDEDVIAVFPPVAGGQES
jgi:molybdopterin synthase sulfur carrier subunit